MVEPITGIAGLLLLSGIARGISKYKEGKASAKADRYRSSLARENAQRADIVGIDKAFRAKREGTLDVGLYQMQVTQSGLSGVSRDLWVGQRYLDMYRDITNALHTREQTVSRFLKEEGWHKRNADASESSAVWSAVGEVLGGGASAYKEYSYGRTR